MPTIQSPDCLKSLKKPLRLAENCSQIHLIWCVNWRLKSLNAHGSFLCPDACMTRHTQGSSKPSSPRTELTDSTIVYSNVQQLVKDAPRPKQSTHRNLWNLHGSCMMRSPFGSKSPKSWMLTLEVSGFIERRFDRFDWWQTPLEGSESYFGLQNDK